MNNHRVIKFRVWDGKKLTYADSYHGRVSYDNGGHPYLVFYLSGRINDHTSLVIQQFTGLLDKNGKEIYEGDIITLTHDSSNVYVGQVVFKSFCWKVQTNFHNWHIELARLTNRLDCFKSFEIIGNIHENSELFKRDNS